MLDKNWLCKKNQKINLWKPKEVHRYIDYNTMRQSIACSRWSWCLCSLQHQVCYDISVRCNIKSTTSSRWPRFLRQLQCQVNSDLSISYNLNMYTMSPFDATSSRLWHLWLLYFQVGHDVFARHVFKMPVISHALCFVRLWHLTLRNIDG